MFGSFQRLWARYQERKRLRDEEALADLKFRYHAFRALLANNERSMDLVGEIEASFKAAAAGGLTADSRLEELLHVTYEMVDGLNRMNGYRSENLYALHKRLSSEIRDILAQQFLTPEPPPLALALHDFRPEMAGQLGGKAASLARLAAYGLPTPKGFVLTLAASRLFFSFNQLDTLVPDRLRRLHANNEPQAELTETAEAIGSLIVGSPLPPELEEALAAASERLGQGTHKALAVRSSAVVEDQAEHSFAGQFTSILNVVGLEALARAYKEVLASNFNARSLAYRMQYGLPLLDFDMAVLFQEMVPASAAGVLYTVDPTDRELGRFLISAVPALGTLAVNGGAPADIYRLPRSDLNARIEQEVAVKTVQEKAVPGGGVRIEPVPEEERALPLLSQETVRALAGLGWLIEYLGDGPQDAEWAADASGRIFLLQSRPLRLPGRRRPASGISTAPPLLQGGTISSPGRALGRVRIVRSAADLDESLDGQAVLVLNQSLVEAARWMAVMRGAIVDLGNPGDHLSTVARERGRPMITGTAEATKTLKEGQWVLLDADRRVVLEVPSVVQDQMEKLTTAGLKSSPVEPGDEKLAPELEKLRQLIVPLNLTDAYGPTFSLMECRSLHDLIRYAHEAALMAMFTAGDELVEDHFSAVHWLDEGLPFHFFIIDLGGGLKPGPHPTRLHLDDVISFPMRSLWEGLSTPGLRWSTPPPSPSLSGLFARTMTEQGGARALGSSNFAILTRDYLNLNTRLDFHFAMIDTVCGPNARENYIRFRFKGGGTTEVQRERRARFISMVLKSEEFSTDVKGDLVTASLAGTGQESAARKLIALGRLLGFSRLLDASMRDDDAPARLAKAFFDEDWALERFS